MEALQREPTPKRRGGSTPPQDPNGNYPHYLPDNYDDTANGNNCGTLLDVPRGTTRKTQMRILSFGLFIIFSPPSQMRTILI
jgi:hypothetical protein